MGSHQPWLMQLRRKTPRRSEEQEANRISQSSKAGGEAHIEAPQKSTDSRRTPTGMKTLRFEVCVVGSYAAILFVLSAINFAQFRVISYDFAVANQLFWNTLNGRFMFSMPECCAPQNPPSYLGSHVSPLVLFLLPIYALYQSPYTLLLIQSIALALPLFFILAIARHTVGSRLSWIVAFAYMVHPATLFGSVQSFHFENFVPLGYVASVYYWNKKSLTCFTAAFLFLLSTYEWGAIIGIGLLAYLWLKENGFRITFKKRADRIILLLAAAASAWFIAASLVKLSAWPQSDIYASKPWALSNITIDPLYKALYWVELLAPLAFIPLMAPMELVAVAPWFVGSLFSNSEPQYDIIWQYPGLVIGQLMIATITGLSRLQTKAETSSSVWRVLRAMPKVRRLFGRNAVRNTGVALVVGATACLATISPLGVYTYTTHPDFTFAVTPPGFHAAAGHAALAVIPNDASVLAQVDILPYLVKRYAPVFAIYPTNGPPPDYIIVDITQGYYFGCPCTHMQSQLTYFTSHYSYGLIASADGYLVYRIGYTGPLTVFVPLEYTFNGVELYESGTDRFYYLSHQESQGSPLFVVPGTDGFAWVGPWISLGPGSYRVDFFVDNQNVPSNSSAITLVAVNWTQRLTFGSVVVPNDVAGMQTVSLNFVLKNFTTSIEFPGTVQPGQTANVTLLRASLVQTG